MKLDIPFVSQRGNKYRNDCGAAVVACLAGCTATAVLAAIAQPANKPLSFFNLYKALRRYGFTFAYKKGLEPEAIRRSLDNGYPSIVLLTYGRLKPELRAVDFADAHWTLITGYENEDFFVHDPLREQGEGGYQRWGEESIVAAMRDISMGNIPNQGLIITSKFPLLEPMAAGDGTDVLRRVLETTDLLRAEMEIVTTQFMKSQNDNDVLRRYLWQLYGALGVNDDDVVRAQGKALVEVGHFEKAHH